jgi:geranylgeranyl diphosphate synthase, type II
LLLINSKHKSGKLKQAMDYALSAGGKRIRPMLMLEVIQAYQMDENLYLDIACAIEMVHTYSLVHDDLPAMDNDDLRRGKPTLHKAFDEGLAILAGDALLTDAFGLIANHQTLSDNIKIDLIATLSRKSGSQGMIHGQYLDLYYENKNIPLEILEEIHLHKTAHLLEAALMMGAIIAQPQDVSKWEKIGRHLGMMFQIQDDILEVTSNEETMGKTLSDVSNQKQTYVLHYGIEASKKAVDLHHSAIIDLLDSLNIDPFKMRNLMDQIYHRTH